MGMPSRSLRAGLVAGAAVTALLAATGAGTGSAAGSPVLWRIPIPLGAPPATATLDRTVIRPVSTLALPQQHGARLRLSGLRFTGWGSPVATVRGSLVGCVQDGFQARCNDPVPVTIELTGLQSFRCGGTTVTHYTSFRFTGGGGGVPRGPLAAGPRGCSSV